MALRAGPQGGVEVLIVLRGHAQRGDLRERVGEDDAGHSLGGDGGEAEIERAQRG